MSLHGRLSLLPLLLQLRLGPGRRRLRLLQPTGVSCPLGPLGELGHSAGGPHRAGHRLSAPRNFSSRLRWDRRPPRSTHHDAQAARLRPVLLLSRPLAPHPAETPQQLPPRGQPLRRAPLGARRPRRRPPPRLLQEVGCSLGAGLCHPPAVGRDTQLLADSPRGVWGLMLQGSPWGRGAGGLSILLPGLWGGHRWTR